MYGLLGVGESDVNVPSLLRRGGKNGELQGVIRGAQIAARSLGDVVERVAVDGDVVHAQPLALIGEGFLHCPHNILRRKPPELEHAAARNYCGGHRGIGIFSRGAYKNNSALLDGGQEGIGLGLVEAVALVEHEIGALAVHLQVVFRLLHGFFDVRHARLHGVELYELAVGGLGDYIGEGSFTRAGRAVKYAAAQAVERDSAAQKAALGNYVFLTYEVVEVVGAHALGERLCNLGIAVKIE